MFAAVTGEDGATVTFDMDFVFGESDFATIVAEEINREKVAGRNGRDDMCLCCSFREVRKIE